MKAVKYNIRFLNSKQNAPILKIILLKTIIHYIIIVFSLIDQILRQCNASKICFVNEICHACANKI